MAVTSKTSYVSSVDAATTLSPFFKVPSTTFNKQITPLSTTTNQLLMTGVQWMPCNCDLHWLTRSCEMKCFNKTFANRFECLHRFLNPSTQMYKHILVQFQEVFQMASEHVALLNQVHETHSLGTSAVNSMHDLQFRNAYRYSSWKASNNSMRSGPAEFPTGGGTCSMTAGRTVSSPKPVLADTFRHVLGSMSKACRISQQH